MNIVKNISLFLFTLSVCGYGQGNTIDSTLKEIELFYVNGQYLSAELEARRMSEETNLNDSVKVQIEKWIAFSLIAQGKSSLAKDRFIALLTIDGTFELDPILTSPKILYVFNDARVKYQSIKKNIKADSVQSAAQQQQFYRSSISYRTIIFPGWEQFHQGREISGYIFSGAGAVTLISGIACELLRSNARDEYRNAKTPAEISAKYDTYNNYRKAEIYSFTAFIVIYLASEVDVFTQSDVSISPTYSLNHGSQMLLSIKF